MQQFTIPQFIDVEDKIIGTVTVRQFLIVLFASGINVLFYYVFDFSLFVMLFLLTFGSAVVFAFVSINGRPFHFFILSIVQVFSKPMLRVWNNKDSLIEIFEKYELLEKDEKRRAPIKNVSKSRLAELALIVDTKGVYRGEKNEGSNIEIIKR